MLNPFLFDLPNWSVISITGPDRKSYLHSFCTNEINKLSDGGICEAFIPNEKGRILGHVFIVNHVDELRLVSASKSNETLVSHLQKYLLGVEAEVTDRDETMSVIAVVGADAPGAIGLSKNRDLNQSAIIPVDSGECLASPEMLTKLPTYLVSGGKAQIDKLKQQLFNKGLSSGTTEQFERLRIEAGFPYVGVDLTDANIVQESARVEATTSFDKGCYLGQEPIARLDAMGHTNKELRGFRIESDHVSPGAKILAEEKEIGVISSVAITDKGQSVGLGIVRVKHATPGGKVAVVTETGTYPAEIFWDHF